MARSFIRVPPDSTGKRTVTRSYLAGPDVVESQGVHFDGLPSYTALFEGTALAQNAYHAYLGNAAGSGRTVYIGGLFLINLQITAITGSNSRFDFRRVTGTPTMTAVTPAAHDSADPALTGITCGRAVTAGLTDGAILATMVQHSDEHAAGVTNIQPLIDGMDRIGPLGLHVRPITLRPGEAVAFKQALAVTVGTIAVLMRFAVEAD